MSILGTIVGGALGLFGASKSSSAAESAAWTQAAAADRATQAQLQMYEQTRTDQAPWRAAGTFALNQLVGTQGTGQAPSGGYWTEPKYEDQITGYRTEYIENPGYDMGGYTIQVPITTKVLSQTPEWVPGAAGTQTDGTTGLLQKGPGEFIPEQEPGYKFGYEEFIEKPSLRLASATGKLGSGATLKALSRYASDYASTKYDNFLDRWYKSLDPYFRMAGMGSNVAIAGGQQAGQTGAGIAGTTLAGGQAQAAGQLGSAYPYSQLANWGATNLMQYGMGQMGTQNTLSNPQWWARTQYTPQQVNQMGWL